MSCDVHQPTSTTFPFSAITFDTPHPLTLVFWLPFLSPAPETVPSPFPLACCDPLALDAPLCAHSLHCGRDSIVLAVMRSALLGGNSEETLLMGRHSRVLALRTDSWRCVRAISTATVSVEAEISCLAVLPSGLVAAGLTNGSLLLLDLQQARVERSLPVGEASALTSLLCAHATQILVATANVEGEIRVLEVTRPALVTHRVSSVGNWAVARSLRGPHCARISQLVAHSFVEATSTPSSLFASAAGAAHESFAALRGVQPLAHCCRCAGVARPGMLLPVRRL